MKHIRVGDYDCYSLLDARFRLDGGAMFGIVPKNIWNKFYDCDEQNRIMLATRMLLIRGRGISLIVEGGIGDVFKGDDKLLKTYAIEESNLLAGELDLAGCKADGITHVTYSHLHWDHCGTACVWTGSSFIPRFKNARYIVNRGEWETALSGRPDTRGSYIAESLIPIRSQAMIIDQDHDINEDIRLIVTGGHTMGHMILTLTSRGQKLVFWGDLVPTSKHIHLPHVMAYDRYPVDTLAMKEKYLRLTCEENYISSFPHDTDVCFGRIAFDGKRFVLGEEIG